jgi:hypothetical protein
MPALPGGDKSRKVIAACCHPLRVQSHTFQQSGGGAALTTGSFLQPLQGKQNGQSYERRAP